MCRTNALTLQSGGKCLEVAKRNLSRHNGAVRISLLAFSGWSHTVEGSSQRGLLFNRGGNALPLFAFVLPNTLLHTINNLMQLYLFCFFLMQL